MIVLLVAVGAAIGAPARYLTDRAVQAHHESGFPWGTFTVNVVASLIFGVVLGLAPSAAVQAVVVTGFCGALSTFSTFSFETVRLWQDGRQAYAAANVGVSVLAALGAVSLGYVVGLSI